MPEHLDQQTDEWSLKLSKFDSRSGAQLMGILSIMLIVVVSSITYGVLHYAYVPLFLLSIVISLLCCCTYALIYLLAQKYQVAWLDRLNHRQKNLQLQALFSTLSPWPVLRFDRHGQLISKNSVAKTYFYSYNTQNRAQRSIYDFFPELSRDDWQLIMSNSQSFAIERNRGGYWLSFYFRAHHQLGMVNVYGYDVTAYKKNSVHLKAQITDLQAVNEIHNQLILSVVNVLQQPVNNINNQVLNTHNIAHSKIGDVYNSHHQDNLLINELNTLQTLVRHLNNCIDLSQTQANQVVCDLRNLIENLVDELAPKAAHLKGELIFDGQFDNEILLLVNDQVCQQILSLLLNFAIHQSAQNITLLTFNTGPSIKGLKTLEFTIEDSGADLDLRILQSILLPQTTTAVSQAVINSQMIAIDYFSLQIAGLLLKTMQAKVQVTPSALGGHLIQIKITTPVASEQPLAPLQQLHQYTIAIADPQFHTVQALSRALRNYGAKVLIFKTLAELKALSNQALPDFIVHKIENWPVDAHRNTDTNDAQNSALHGFEAINSWAYSKGIITGYICDHGIDFTAPIFHRVSILKCIQKPIRASGLPEYINQLLAKDSQQITNAHDDLFPEINMSEARRLVHQNIPQFERALLSFYGRFTTIRLSMDITDLRLLQTRATHIGAYHLRDLAVDLENKLSQQVSHIALDNGAAIDTLYDAMQYSLAKTIQETQVLLHSFSYMQTEMNQSIPIAAAH